jgi:hypothetical protein
MDDRVIVLIQRILLGEECNKPSVCPTKDRVYPERSRGKAILVNGEKYSSLLISLRLGYLSC